MDARQLWMWLMSTAVLSVAAMVIGVLTSNQALAVLAGAMFAIVASIVGWRFAGLAESSQRGAAVSARFARLIATAWGWAGAAMLGCYYLTELHWQHAWQYGLGMLLIAGLLSWYAGQRLDEAAAVSGAAMVSAVRWMTGLQGIAALAGVFILAMAGKLQPEKADWAANIVFVAGGLAIFALSMAALRAEKRATGGTEA